MKKEDSTNPRGVSKEVFSAPSGSEGMTLLDSANLFLSLLGGGISIAGLFGSGGPSMSDLLNKLEFEVEQVFLQDLVEEATDLAKGHLQAASDFLGMEYLTDINNGETKEELWTLLNRDGWIAKLDSDASTMEGWARDNPKAIAQQTTSLALMLHGLIVTFFREMALQAPDGPTQAANKANMRNYAKKAVDRVYPLYKSVYQSRIGGISAIQFTRPFPQFAPLPFFTDAWFPTSDPSDPVVMVQSEADDGTKVTKLREAYRRLLQSGTPEDAGELTRAAGSFDDGDPTAQEHLTKFIPQIPSFQTTGRWLAQAPVALQNLRKIAGTLDYEVAYSAPTASLCTAGPDGSRDWMLGMMENTSPSITASPGGYMMAFQDNGGGLWHAGTWGNGRDNFPVSAASSPCVVAMPDGSFRTVFYCATNSHLFEIDPQNPGHPNDLGFGIMAGTSPSAAVVGLTVGSLFMSVPLIAFQTDNGFLGMVGPDEGITSFGMMQGTSPSIAMLSDDGGHVVAFQNRGGQLSTVGPDGLKTWDLPLAPGTSPSIAASSRGGGYRVACQGADHSLYTAGPEGLKNLGQVMMPGTSPSITALEISGYQIAFQDKTGMLVTVGDSLALALGPLPVRAGTSPSIARLIVQEDI